MTPSLTDDAVLTALRAFLLAVLPDSIEVVQGQPNRVPEPRGPDHVVMTPTRRTQMGTTEHSYDADAGSQDVERSTAIHMQLDVYGPLSTDNSQVITTLFRDAWGCDFFKPYGIQPLYCDDGQQMPLVNGEFQYENRWMIKATLHGSPVVAVPVEFADTVITTLLEAD